MAATLFHGTRLDSDELITAIARNCTCAFGIMGVRTSTCAGHDMLVNDQRALNGLVWERRLWAAYFPGAGLRVIRPTDTREM